MGLLRRTAFAGSLMLILAGSGYSDDEVAQPSACEELWAQLEDSVGADGEVFGFSPEDESTFVVKAQNGSDEGRRLTVDLNGEPEINIEIPGLLGCSHPPVLTFGFDYPAGEVEVEARSGDLSSAESVTILDQQTTWLVVQIFDDEVITSGYRSPTKCPSARDPAAFDKRSFPCQKGLFADAAPSAHPTT